MSASDVFGPLVDDDQPGAPGTAVYPARRRKVGPAWVPSRESDERLVRRWDEQGGDSYVPSTLADQLIHRRLKRIVKAARKRLDEQG